METIETKLLNQDMVSANVLSGITFAWAWEHYLNGCANHWMPNEIGMQRDIELWSSSRLSDDERRLFLWTLAYFGGGESLVGNNIVLAIFRHITNPECRQYLLRQAFEEAVHTHAFQYVCASLGLNADCTFGQCAESASVKAKNEFQVRFTRDLLDPGFTTRDVEGVRRFLKNLISYYVTLEGIFFYSGFAMTLALNRRNKMMGFGEIVHYIMRDETVHLNFGIDLINTIRQDCKGAWSPGFQSEVRELIEEAVVLESRYAATCLERPIVGLRSEMFGQFVRYVADRRLERIGLQVIYHAKNPFSWISELGDLPKERNFFDTTVMEYQKSAALFW